jgi:hypothetical protein
MGTHRGYGRNAQAAPLPRQVESVTPSA